ncbi:uncharacterized protein V6R79_014226 [Siganus canaliculatus]
MASFTLISRQDPYAIMAAILYGCKKDWTVADVLRNTGTFKELSSKSQLCPQKYWFSIGLSALLLLPKSFWIHHHGSWMLVQNVRSKNSKWLLL